ncbi:MAG: sulfatase-like hydrolase/transferase, partial [Flavobacteriaceae bacterium]
IYKLYSNQADEVYNREDIMKNDTFFDENVISKFKEIIHNKSTKKKLIIIHLYGSHYNYNNKYPLEFKKFRPTLSEKSQIEYTKRDQLINSYDNSILYTDFVLSKLINDLKGINKHSFLFYLSDHGENLYDDKDKYVFHSYPIPKKYELEIPFFIWTSQKYNLSNYKKIKALKSNSSKKISTTYLFETIIDMANIKYPLQDFSKSLSSEKFNSSNKRYILTVENKLIQYDK